MVWYNAIMVTTLTLDKAGRIVLPKPVRDELQLEPGQSLELESSGDKIILRPARRRARMYKKGGIWVLHTGAPIPPGNYPSSARGTRATGARQAAMKYFFDTSVLVPAFLDNHVHHKASN
jgi:AbrB family looped-hinge helix DNA binding protein